MKINDTFRWEKNESRERGFEGVWGGRGDDAVNIFIPQSYCVLKIEVWVKNRWMFIQTQYLSCCCASQLMSSVNHSSSLQNKKKCFTYSVQSSTNLAGQASESRVYFLFALLLMCYDLFASASCIRSWDLYVQKSSTLTSQPPRFLSNSLYENKFKPDLYYYYICKHSN